MTIEGRDILKTVAREQSQQMRLCSAEMPEIVRIELSNTCNMSCPHCRHHSKEKRASENYSPYYRTPIHMSEKQVEDIFNEVAPYKPSVTLNVANEPLIAQTFDFAVKTVKKLGLAGTFNTNGILLNKDVSTLLVDTCFDSVTISIDAITAETLKKARGISSLDKLIDNVDILLSVRGNSVFPRVGITFVETDYNYHEIPDFLEFWKKRVDFIRINGFIKDLTPDVSMIPGIQREDMPKRIPCQQTFRDIVIRANGDVTPCVITAEQPSIIVGNIFKEGGVKAVWNNDHMNHIRKLHNTGRWDELPYCRQCDYWIETFSMKEEIKNGFLIRMPSPYTTFYNVLDRLDNWNRDLHDRQGVGRFQDVSVTKK
ncbi:MAG: SPASM domain-containing protein [Nitrospirae bacterium]|nr:SPASM domain-containing protein [Nitrospirota bacterium]MBF0519240.1 SPASM domain-containing protein [Nitrospirota bacterium]MBF0535772.1 SPASM domain-containing protein [Nitrospirota bacterium]MBF0617687.1 SPASM domain-containing protein [Nitrospirota bacterium]